MIRRIKDDWLIVLCGIGLAALWLASCNAPPSYPPDDCVVVYDPFGPTCA